MSGPGSGWHAREILLVSRPALRGFRDVRFRTRSFPLGAERLATLLVLGALPPEELEQARAVGAAMTREHAVEYVQY
jgi:hypothetical protein